MVSSFVVVIVNDYEYRKKNDGYYLEWKADWIEESYLEDTTKLLVASGSKTDVTDFSFDDSECSEFNTAVQVDFSISRNAPWEES